MKNFLIPVTTVVSIIVLLTSFSQNDLTGKAELGRLLFFDTILSRDKTISCASCHQPDHAFADTSPVSKGVGGVTGTRNTPSAMNLSLQRIFFWDGRARSLEEQALAPIENPLEMNLPILQALSRLKESDRYNRYFKEVFNSEPTRSNLAEALAAFERTLETSETPFDEWKFYNDSMIVSDEVKRGFEVFNGTGKCNTCHFGADFTTNELRNIGLFNGRNLNDSGRSTITGKAEDLGKFKVPSLRNVAISTPYMHNGMFRSLKEVIEFYNDPDKIVPDALNRDSILSKPLGLTTRQMEDLEAFLRSLTDKRFATRGSRY